MKLTLLFIASILVEVTVIQAADQPWNNPPPQRPSTPSGRSRRPSTPGGNSARENRMRQGSSRGGLIHNVNVEVTVRYEFIPDSVLFRPDILPETFPVNRTGAAWSPLDLWRLKLADIPFGRYDIRATAYARSDERFSAPRDVPVSEPLTIQQHFTGPIVLVIEELENECPGSLAKMRIGQHLTKLLRCDHRFNLSFLALTHGGCPTGRFNCDRFGYESCANNQCGQPLTGDNLRKFMCGHFFHADCAPLSELHCRRCHKVYYEVGLLDYKGDINDTSQVFYDKVHTSSERDKTPRDSLRLIGTPEAMALANRNDLTAIFTTEADRDILINISLDTSIASVVEQITDPIFMQIAIDTVVEIQKSYQYGTVKFVKNTLVTNEHTANDFLTRGLVNPIVVVFDADVQPAHYQPIGFNDPLVLALSGMRRPVVRFVGSTTVSFSMPSPRHNYYLTKPCWLHFDQDNDISVADVFDKCVEQFRQIAEQSHSRSALISTDRNDYRYSYVKITRDGDLQRPLRSFNDTTHLRSGTVFDLIYRYQQP